MGVTEWVILGVAIAAVLMVYLFTRRNDGPNPWRDMDDGDSELPEQGSDAAEGPDVLVDPSVAAEWENFTPDAASPTPVGEPTVDVISPAEQRQEPVIEKPMGYVSEPRVVTNPATRVEPQLEPQPEPVQAPQPEPTAAQAGKAAPEGETQNEKIIVLHIANRESEIQGPQIHAALEAAGLRYGPREIYHRVADVAGRAESVFSIANMLKPGTLHPDEAEDLVTRGLVMFMQLPGPVDGNKAFHDMLNSAQELANALGGSVLDDKRLPLTRQAAQALIDEIAEFERQQRLAQA